MKTRYRVDWREGGAGPAALAPTRWGCRGRVLPTNTYHTYHSYLSYLSYHSYLRYLNHQTNHKICTVNKSYESYDSGLTRSRSLGPLRACGFAAFLSPLPKRLKSQSFIRNFGKGRRSRVEGSSKRVQTSPTASNRKSQRVRVYPAKF